MSQPGTELEARTPLLLSRPEVISNDEIDRLFRVAKGLAMSGVYKDVRSAEQGFSKLIVGHELGLNISQSMSIHFVEGQVTVPYPLLGLFVKAHGWTFDYPTLTDDLVEIEFTDPNGKTFLSKFDIEDAVKAKIVKRLPDGSLATMGGKTSMYEKFGRNMLVARAISNGVRWFVQEATGGLPIYAHGELDDVERESLTSGEGDGSASGIALPPAVEAVIARAAEVGHSGYADRPTAEISLGGRSPEVVDAWVERAEQELDALEASHVTDADVVPPEPAAAPQTPAQDASDTLSGGVALPAEIPNSAGSSAAPDSRPAAQEPSAVPLPPDAAAVDMVDIPRDEATDQPEEISATAEHGPTHSEAAADGQGSPPPSATPEVDPEVLRRRLADLQAQDLADLDDDHRSLLEEEVSWIEARLVEAGGQEQLDV